MLDDGPTTVADLSGVIDPALQEYYRLILNTIEWLTANGKAENTIRQVSYTLKRLNLVTDLTNPEAVKLYIGQLKISNQSKQKLCNNYDYFVKTNGLEWQKHAKHG